MHYTQMQSPNQKGYNMNLLARISLAVVCLFSAIACYVFVIPFGGEFFLILGFILEVLFWFGLFGKKKKHIKVSRYAGS